jgi:hypothetical protein
MKNFPIAFNCFLRNNMKYFQTSCQFLRNYKTALEVQVHFVFLLNAGTEQITANDISLSLSTWYYFFKIRQADRPL